MDLDLDALRTEALNSARKITDPRERANALMLVASKGLQADQRTTALEEAADIIRSYEDPKDRAENFTYLLIASGDRKR